MVDKIEMSLDDIIKSNRGQRQKPAGRERKKNVKSAPIKLGRIQKAKIARGDGTWKHDKFEGPRRILKAANNLTKLIVSNLDYGVSDVDIHELFAEFGTIRKAAIHYDRSGRSVGTAEVIFERRPDAIKAIKQYNGVPLDGRPMKIELATSDMSTLVGSGRLGVSPASGAGGQQRRRQGGNVVPAAKRGGVGGQRRGPPNRGPQNRGRASGTAGAGGRARGANKSKVSAPTAEELDAELDAYVNDMKI